MKTINVVAAIIVRENCVLATQKAKGDWKDFWEFPGGKIEQGEKAEDAVVREIREELSATVSVQKEIATVEYDYPQFHLFMRCFLCALKSDEIFLNEHKNFRWISRADLKNLKWLPADECVLEKIASFLD